MKMVTILKYISTSY